MSNEEGSGKLEEGSGCRALLTYRVGFSSGDLSKTRRVDKIIGGSK